MEGKREPLRRRGHKHRSEQPENNGQMNCFIRILDKLGTEKALSTFLISSRQRLSGSRGDDGRLASLRSRHDSPRIAAGEERRRILHRQSRTRERGGGDCMFPARRDMMLDGGLGAEKAARQMICCGRTRQRDGEGSRRSCEARPACVSCQLRPWREEGYARGQTGSVFRHSRKRGLGPGLVWKAKRISLRFLLP
jgi:hypothetical protein